MGFEITPFALVLTLTHLCLAVIFFFLIKRKRHKTAIFLVCSYLLVFTTKPVKLTTDTVRVNRMADLKVKEKHEQQLNTLPLRKVVERPSYDDFLKSEKEKIKGTP